MSIRLRVLFVEDSEDDMILILHEMRRGGLDVVSTRVETGEDMVRELKEHDWDIIIADYVLPKFSAWDALEVYNQSMLEIPFIIVSGTIGEDIAVKAMKAGAHDYVMKDKLARLVPAITRELGDAEDRIQKQKAEEELAKSQRSLSTLMNNLPGMAYRCLNRPDWKMLFVSDGCEELTGYMSSEIIGNGPVQFADLIHAEDREATWDAVQEAVAKGRQFTLTYRLASKSGEEKWVWERGRAVDETINGDAVLEGLLIDISDRVRAEDEVLERKELMETVINNVPQFQFFWKNKESVYLGCNQDFAETLGLKNPDDIIGKTDYDLWRDDAKAIREIDRQIIASDLPRMHSEERITCPVTGNTAWLDKSVVPLHDPEGKVMGVLGFYQDITERKKAESDLRLTQFSVEHTADSAFWIEPNGEFYYVNRQACESLGYTKEEFAKLKVFDIDPSLGAERWKSHWEMLRREKAVNFKSKQRRKDGSEFYTEVSSNYLNFDGKEYSFSFVRDVTEQMLAEMRERTIQAEAEEAKRQFYRQTISSVTDGKLNLVTYDDINDSLAPDAITIPLGSAENIAALRNELAQLCDEVRMSEDRAFSLITAASEAAANAIKHADNGIAVIGTKDHNVQVCVKDNGMGMDALVLPNATLMRRFSTKPSMGLGYSLILAMVDTVYLATDKQGTWVLMEKAAAEIGEEISLDMLPDNW